MSDPGKREIKRFLKFAVVGAWGFIVDFTILNLLMFGAHFPAWLANTCSFTIAVLNTFILNRLWTFPESRQRPIAQAVRAILCGERVRVCDQRSSIPGQS